jgi:hypothetical protein
MSAKDGELKFLWTPRERGGEKCVVPKGFSSLLLEVYPQPHVVGPGGAGSDAAWTVVVGEGTMSFLGSSESLEAGKGRAEAEARKRLK